MTPKPPNKRTGGKRKYEMPEYSSWKTEFKGVAFPPVVKPPITKPKWEIEFRQKYEGASTSSKWIDSMVEDVSDLLKQQKQEWVGKIWGMETGYYDEGQGVGEEYTADEFKQKVISLIQEE